MLTTVEEYVSRFGPAQPHRTTTRKAKTQAKAKNFYNKKSLSAKMQKEGLSSFVNICRFVEHGIGLTLKELTAIFAWSTTHSVRSVRKVYGLRDRPKSECWR
jgi:hypothetical protein